MKIVHVITRLILGGAQENTLITCREQALAGHDVTLITGPALGPEGGLFHQTQGQPYKTIVLDKMVREIKPLWDLQTYFELKKILKQISPDIVHTHSAKAGIIGRWAASAIRKKNQGSNRPGIVHTIHGLAFHEYQSERKNKLYVAIEKATLKHTDAFIGVADTMRDKALAAGLGNKDMYTTAYSAIDEQDFLEGYDPSQIKDFRRKYGISDQAIVLVTVARLAELKGHEYIIESAKELAEKYDKCIWLFVGDGHLSKQIKEQIRLASLGYRFKFTGLLDPAEIPLAIHSSDILVHCSLREGLARVLPQAMLCGKPAVSFDIDGAKEVVNENTGRLIEPENIGKLVQACDELIRDENLRMQIGETARESVRKKFAPQTMVETIMKVYEKVLNQL